VLARLQSFGSWGALQAAGHVHTLHISATSQERVVKNNAAELEAGSGSDCDCESDWEWEYETAPADEATQRQVLDALATAAGACGSQLQELHIMLDDGLPAWRLPDSLARALPNLRTLSIDNGGDDSEVAVGAPLALLTALEELASEHSGTGRGFTLDPAVPLPPSLTRLHLDSPSGSATGSR